MARLIEYANGLRRIEFTLAKGGPRRLVRLGRMPRRDAKMLNSRLEHIIAAKTVGFAIDAETGRWLGNSPAVAARHFAMSTDRDGSFQRAISREPVGVKSAVDLAGITAKTVKGRERLRCPKVKKEPQWLNKKYYCDPGSVSRWL